MPFDSGDITMRTGIWLVGIMIFISSFVFGGEQSGIGDVLNERLKIREREQDEERDQRLYEQELRRLRNEEKLQEERNRLDRERQKREEAQRLADRPPLPDLNKAPTWADVMAKPEFASLTATEQAQAKAAYFDYWIAPHAGAQAKTLREQFLAPKPLLSEQQWQWIFAGCGVFVLLTLFWQRRAVARSFEYMVQNGLRISALLIAVSIAVLVGRVVWLGIPLMVVR